MKTLNISKKFTIGKTVIVFKKLPWGIITVPIGERGIIKKISINNFRSKVYRILHIDIVGTIICMSDQMAKDFFNII